jgi:hypothetical protein
MPFSQQLGLLIIDAVAVAEENQTDSYDLNFRGLCCALLYTVLRASSILSRS